MKFTIDTDFTVPEAPARGKGKKPEKYPFAQLVAAPVGSKGNSFFVPNSQVNSGNAFETLKQTAYNAEKRREKRKENARFLVVSDTINAGTENETHGARVFRTE